MEISVIKDYNRISYIYRTFMRKDFPRNELKPLESIKRMWARDSYDCYQMTENDKVTGYAFFVKQVEDGKANFLLDYFAITEEYRNQGLGSMLLSRVLSYLQNANCVVVEVEDPDDANDEESEVIKNRRLWFYLRNGFSETGITARVFGVQYKVLELHKDHKHTKDEVRDIYESFYRKMVPALIFIANIKIH